MPKSRKRKPHKPRRAPKSQRSLRPGECLDVDPRHLDEVFDRVMTPRDLEAWEAAAAAEAAGDPETALARRLEAPYVVGTMQLVHLRELVELGPEAPGWVINRWITGQAERWILSSHDPRAEDTVLTAWLAAWDSDLEQPSGWSFRAFGTALAANDWIVHQLMGHEYGGLLDFVDVVAADGLLVRADQIDAWAMTPMGGYRLVEVRGDRLLVSDLADGSTLELLNVGAMMQREEHATVLGRVVPVSVGPGLMFDRRPLGVDPTTAEEAARSVQAGHDMGWIDAITKARIEGRLTPGFSMAAPTLLSSDLVVDPPRHEHEEPGGEPAGRVRELMGLGLSERVANAVATCEVALIAVAVSGDDAAASMCGIITPALIDREIVAALRQHAVGPEHAVHWKQLAQGAVEPVRTRCLELSILCRQAA